MPKKPKEYIERGALEYALRHEILFNENIKLSEFDECLWLSIMSDFVENLPTADVVEVTYCRDCQHWNNNIPYPDEFGCCQKHNLEIMRENDFCSYGERKE